MRVTGTIYGNVPLKDLVDADDLKAIEALTGTSGWLKKTAANTWALGTFAASDIPNIDTSKITSGTLPIARGGTGLTASPSMLTNLASTTAANVLQASPRPGITGTLGLGNGGTGATTAANAVNNLLSGAPNWTAVPTDSTYFIRQDTGGSNSFGRAPFSTVWTYIKGKADSVYAASGHNHDATYVNVSGDTMTGALTLSGAPTANLHAATKQYVDQSFAANDAMIFKGTIGSSGATVTALPATHNAGWTYRVITAGTYAGVACEIGDLIICITDGTSANNAHWTVAQTNIDGAVIGSGDSLDGNIAIFSGTTGKLIVDGGCAVGDISLKSHVHGKITSDGKIASSDNVTIANNDRLIISDASDSYILKNSSITFDGSTTTKALTQKGTWETFNNYSHPTSAGNIHIPSGGSSGQYLKYGGSSGTATWASFTKPSVTWTDGTSNGPTLKITTDGGASDAVAVPSASAAISGIVTTGSQTFAGDKTFGGTDAFTVKATSIRFQNKAGNTSQALSGSSNGTKYPYVTSLMIGDGREVTLDEYGDGYLGIHSKHGIFIQSNAFDIKEYDATKTYSVGALVWYDRKYYRCTTAISTAEAWTAGHWTAVPSGSGTIVIDGTVQPLVTGSKDLGTLNYKWDNLYAQKINGTTIASVTAQTTQAVYPIKINAIGQITGYGSAQTILALGTTATTAAAGNHTHTTSIATDTGTTGVVALTSGGTFKLTSGGTSVLFKMPTSTNNAGTITGVTGSDGLTGSGTSGSVTIKHAAPSTSPAKTTSAVYPITIDKYGHITAAGTAVTIPAAVSVKGNAETSYRTGQVNLTPANLGISATTSSVTVGSTTFSKYSHPTGDGNKHVPATGTTNNNKFLKAGSTAGSLSWTTIASVSNEILTIVS